MEIPENVQVKLKCSKCNELLSCGPVYLIHETGGTICGRCSTQLDETESTESNRRTRNDPYEATASLLAFPCTFAPRGCPEKVKFTLGQPSHESNCKFRSITCPIATHGSCEWMGSRINLEEHCRDAHPEHFSQNPCVIPPPNLTRSYLSNYLVSAFNLLFLIHLKVCVNSGKLCHSVQMLSDSKLLDKFSYTLEIEGNDLMVKKKGSVLGAGIFALEELTAISTSINSLLDFLGSKYNESKFTFTIHTLLNFSCVNCLKNIISPSKFCEECLGKLVKCRFSEKSCSFVDVNEKKCEKHERYFCEYQTKCCFCHVNFVGGGSFIEHFNSSTSCCNKIIKTNINSVVRVNNEPNYILFSSNTIGNIVCDYYLSDSNFCLSLFTPLPLYELKNFKCSIELTDPQTKHTQILTPEIEYNNWWDLYINEKMDNFPSWQNDGIDVKVNIDKI